MPVAQSTILKVFYTCQILAAMSLIVALGGLIALQNNCNTYDGQLWKEHLLYTRTLTQTCSNYLGYQWFGWALAAFALCVVAVVSTDLLPKFKAAMWSLLCASIVAIAPGLNGVVTAAVRGTDDSTFYAQAITVIVGLSCYCFFAFLIMYSGTAASYQPGRADLGGIGVDSLQRRATLARQVSTSVSKKLEIFSESVVWSNRSFIACQVLAWVGWAIALGGIASLQSYCFANPEEVASFKLAWIPNYGAEMNCSRLFSTHWFSLAFAFVALVLLALSWYGKLTKYKSATWAVLLCSASYNFIPPINNLAEWMRDADGTFKTNSTIAFVGYIIYDVAVFAALFCGSAYFHSCYTAGYSTFVIKGNAKVDGSTRNASTARKLLLVLYICAWAANIVCLVGLCLYTANSDPAFTKVFPSANLRFCWFTWALQFITMLMIAIVWHRDSMRQWKSSVWLTALTAASLNMLTASSVFRSFPVIPDGDVATAVKIAFGGYVAWDTFIFLSIFVASYYAWERRHIVEDEELKETVRDAVEMEKGGGDSTTTV